MSKNSKKKKAAGNAASSSKKPVAKNMKNNNILTRFFSHNITLLILSFVLAFTIWFIININSTTESSETIANIPIRIELSDAAKENGLEVFRVDDISASVEVSGNRITVDSLTADDITVYATQMDSIITPDVYTRPVTAKKTGIKNNYEIVSAVTPSSVTFRVDRRKEKDITIENNINVNRDSNTYLASKTITPTTIHVSGPEQEVNRIATAEAFDSITVGSSETTTKSVKVIFRDVDGNLLNNLEMITTDIDEVTATAIVYPTKELSAKVDLKDAPSSCPDIDFSSETIKIAGPQESLNKVQDSFLIINDKPIYFDELDNTEHTFEFDLNQIAPEGCLIVSPDSKKITATLDLSGYSKTSVDCSIVPTNIDTSKYQYEFLGTSSNTVSVRVCGPPSRLSILSDKNITVEADFKGSLDDVPDSGVTTKDITLTVKISSAYSDCWVYGTYKISVDISKK